MMSTITRTTFNRLLLMFIIGLSVVQTSQASVALQVQDSKKYCLLDN